MTTETRIRPTPVTDGVMAPFEVQFQGHPEGLAHYDQETFAAHAAAFRQSNVPVEFGDAFSQAYAEVVSGEYPTSQNYQQLAMRLFGKRLSPAVAEYAVVYGVVASLFKNHESYEQEALRERQTELRAVTQENAAESRKHAEEGLKTLHTIERQLTGQDNLIFRGKMSQQALAWTRESVETHFATKSNQERMARFSRKSAPKPLRKLQA